MNGGHCDKLGEILRKEKVRRKIPWYCPICKNNRFDDRREHQRRHQKISVQETTQRFRETRSNCRHSFRSDTVTAGWGRREAGVFTQVKEIVCIKCGMVFKPIELPPRPEPLPMLAYTDQFKDTPSQPKTHAWVKARDDSQNPPIRELIVLVGRDAKAAEGFLSRKFPTRREAGFFVVTARPLDLVSVKGQLEDRGIPIRILGAYRSGHSIRTNGSSSK